MALSPAQLASTWTWFGTGISTMAKSTMAKENVQKVAAEAVKVIIKTAA